MGFVLPNQECTVDLSMMFNTVLVYIIKGNALPICSTMVRRPV